jgi:hypothetical protein
MKGNMVGVQAPFVIWTATMAGFKLLWWLYASVMGPCQFSVKIDYVFTLLTHSPTATRLAQQ